MCPGTRNALVAPQLVWTWCFRLSARQNLPQNFPSPRQHDTIRFPSFSLCYGSHTSLASSPPNAFSPEPSLRTVHAVVSVTHYELYRQYGETGSRRNAVKNGILSNRFCKRTNKLWRSRATVVACENVIDFHSAARLYVNFSLHFTTAFFGSRPSPRARRYDSLGDFVFVNFIWFSTKSFFYPGNVEKWRKPKTNCSTAACFWHVFYASRWQTLVGMSTTNVHGWCIKNYRQRVGCRTSSNRRVNHSETVGSVSVFFFFSIPLQGRAVFG